jgi:hypothetical protein
MSNLDPEEVRASMRAGLERRERRERLREENSRLSGKERERRALTPIVGEKLSSVEFVMDYVQLRFDGPTLTAFTMPVVAADGRVFRVGEPGYRDALCERIAVLVTAADVSAEAIAIDFADGARITVALREEDQVTPPESAMFDEDVPGEGVWIFPSHTDADTRRSTRNISAD